MNKFPYQIPSVFQQPLLGISQGAQLSHQHPTSSGQGQSVLHKEQGFMCHTALFLLENHMFHAIRF